MSASVRGVAPAVREAGAGQGSAQLSAQTAADSGDVPSPQNAAPQSAGRPCRTGSRRVL